MKIAFDHPFSSSLRFPWGPKGVFVAIPLFGILAGCGGGGGGGSKTVSSYTYLGAIGSSAQLSQPDAIALDASGNIYIANFAPPVGPSVAKFDSSGTFLYQYGNTGTSTTGLLGGAQGIAVDGTGNTYVADSFNGQIDMYDPTGKFVKDLFSNQIGNDPYQIAIDSSGNFYVTASDLGEVLKFSPSGTLLLTFGKTGAAGGILQDPDGVAIDPSGNVYVSDYKAGDIVEYNASGAFVKSFGNTGAKRLTGPQGIFYSSTAGIFVADLRNNYVYHYDLNGAFIETIGSASGPGQLSGPYDVAINSAGILLVVDENHNRVAEFGKPAALASR